MANERLPLHICNSIKQYVTQIRITKQLSIQDKVNLLILLVLLLTQNSMCNGFNSRNSMLRTRVIGTRYGKLQGVILPMDQHKYLKPVEAYLGVPYATPPTGSNRYVMRICCYN